MLQNAIQKAGVLIEALPYIKRFRDKTVVVKIGGATIEKPELLDSVLTDIVFMEQVGMRPVLVHGGGTYISSALKEKKLETRFVHGYRVTDKEALNVVVEVLQHKLNMYIVRKLADFGAFSVSSGRMNSNVLFTKKKVLPEFPNEDLGFVGDVERVNTDVLESYCQRDTVPVIAPLGTDGEQTYNINADDVASAVAGALQAEKLVVLSDVPGLLEDLNAPDSLITTIDSNRVEDLMQRNVIRGGMIPKIKSSLACMRAGVNKVHIVNGAMKHALLLEIFTQQGIGTQIVGNERSSLEEKYNEYK